MADNSLTNSDLRNTIQPFIVIARRHRRPIVGAWAGIMACGLAIAFFSPSVFRSEGRIFVRVGRDSTALDPAALVGQNPVSVAPSSREQEINSIIEILQGRGLMEKLAERLTPDAVMTDRSSLMESIIPRTGTANNAVAAAKLDRMIDVTPVRKSNLVSITCDAHDLELAKRAIEALIELFLVEHRDIYRTPGAHEFFAEQTASLGKQLAETEAELLKLKNAAGVGSVVDQNRLLMGQIGALEDELVEAESKTRASEALVAAIEKKLQTMPRISVFQQISGLNPAADSMLQQFYELQLREKELSSRLTDEHPLVKQVREQLEGARKILDVERQEKVQTVQSRDRAHQELEVSLVTEQTSLESLRAKAAALKPAIEQARARLSALNAAETQIAHLERQRDLQRDNYLKHSQALEQTRIDRALDSERISNITVVQPPLADTRPIKPNRLLTLMMTFVLATLAAVGTGAGLDYLERASRASRTPDAEPVAPPSEPEYAAVG